MDFSKRLRELRDTYNLTLTELEKLSGISKSFLSYMERGLKSPTIETIEKLADAFGISIVELIGKDKYLSENLKLIMGNLSIGDFLEDIKQKIGLDIFDENDIKNYLAGSVIPQPASLQIFADYAGVSLDFFYKKNNYESFENEKKLLQDYNKLAQFKNDKDIIEIFKNDDYIRILKKIYENGVNIKVLEGIVDTIIAQLK